MLCGCYGYGTHASRGFGPSPVVVSHKHHSMAGIVSSSVLFTPLCATKPAVFIVQGYLKCMLPTPCIPALYLRRICGRFRDSKPFTQQMSFCTIGMIQRSNGMLGSIYRASERAIKGEREKVLGQFAKQGYILFTLDEYCLDNTIFLCFFFFFFFF